MPESEHIPPPKPIPQGSRRRRRDTPEVIEQRLLAADRRTDQRVAAAVSWNECCIPGCRTPLRYSRVTAERDASWGLPMCNRHLVISMKQAAPAWDDPDIVAARLRWGRQQAEDSDERQRRLENDGADGHIYFVRQNGLVKVGWSGRLASRLKQYGANVEILCHFPATRADETNLHRQLRPYLARGREWYEDCPLIHDVVAQYVAQHGPPTIKPFWTKPKSPTVRPRRAG